MFIDYEIFRVRADDPNRGTVPSIGSPAELFGVRSDAAGMRGAPR